MPERLWRFYRGKRVVNINVNIVAGSLAAIALTLIPVHIAKHHIESHVWLTLIAGASDVFFDVVIYYALHWVANHAWRRNRKRDIRKERLEFFKDASLVQFERAILSPLYYVIALSLTHTLLGAGLMPEWATFIAFTAGIVVTRIIHTIWGLRTGRFLSPRHRKRLKQKTGPAPKPGARPTGG